MWRRAEKRGEQPETNGGTARTTTTPSRRGRCSYAVAPLGSERRVVHRPGFPIPVLPHAWMRHGGTAWWWSAPFRVPAVWGQPTRITATTQTFLAVCPDTGGSVSVVCRRRAA